jgi:hypothetical protein
MMNRGLCATAFLSAAYAASAIAAPAVEPSAADKATIFKAAGFKAKGGKFIRCEDDSPSAMPGSIEMEDLNSDGNAEAWVKESSTNCYGMTAEAFVLLTKDAKSNWTIILDQVGIAVVQTKKHKGWFDIEVGGPGMGPFPVYRYNGKKYATR